MKSSALLPALAAALAAALPAPAADAPAQAPKKPIFWFQLRSWERVEERITSFGRLSGVQGMDNFMLGAARMALLGLGGVDRERPLSAVLTEFTGKAPPRFLLTVPVASKEEIQNTVGGLFDGMTEEAGAVLRLTKGPQAFFARFDDRDSTFLLASDRETLSLAAPLPDPFSADPDLDALFAFDLDAFREAEKEKWDGAVKEAREGLARMRKELEADAETEPGRAAARLWGEMVEKAALSALEDAKGVEIRMALSPKGWRLDYSALLHPGSPWARFAAAQKGRSSRSAALLDAKGLMGMEVGLLLTEEIRAGAKALLAEGRKAAEEEIRGRPGTTEEAQTARLAAANRCMDVFEKAIEGPSVDGAWEFRFEEGKGEFGLWTFLPEGGKALRELLEEADALGLREEKRRDLTLNFDRHGETAIHRVTGLDRKDETAPEHMFFAGEGDLLAGWAGASADPLKALLDRARAAGGKSVPTGGSLLHAEFSVKKFFEFGMSMKARQRGPAAADAMFAAMFADAFKGLPDEPAVFTLRAGDAAVSLRYEIPGSFVEAFSRLVAKGMQMGMAGGPGAENRPPGPAPDG